MSVTLAGARSLSLLLRRAGILPALFCSAADLKFEISNLKSQISNLPLRHCLSDLFLLDRKIQI